MESFDAVVVATVLGILSSRLSYILLHLNEFGWNWPAWISLDGYPGLWAWTGLLVAAAYLYRWASNNKLDSWEMWDFLSILASWYFGWYWLSRFFFGAAGGSTTTLPWGVVFPHRVEPAHPVQLYATVIYLLLFAYLWWVEPRYRFFLWYRSKKRTARTGFLFSVFLMGSGLLGFLLGFFQYPFFLIWDFDLNQIVSLTLFFLGALTLYIRSGRTFFRVGA